ncbi:hypothetical protein [Streptomyces sp. NPDC048603]|uniref:hypothetical protein n=1 Tax=Streptomyces sp. NPDC048603 TaxID=3365577 RepID=UPI0037213E73
MSNARQEEQEVAMEDQGGAGGVPLHHGGSEEERRRPHVTGPGTDGRSRNAPEGADRLTRAADTDEASRLDRPEPGDDGHGGTRWRGPRHG